MSNTNDGSTPSKRDTYEATVSGAQDSPLLPHLRSDAASYHSIPHSLEEFRTLEGKEERRRRLRELWNQLPQPRSHGVDYRVSAKILPVAGMGPGRLTPEAAEKLKEMYDEELLGRCGGTGSTSGPHPIGWKAFERYAEAKEAGMLIVSRTSIDTFLPLVTAPQNCGRYSMTNLTSMETAT